MLHKLDVNIGLSVTLAFAYWILLFWSLSLWLEHLSQPILCRAWEVELNDGLSNIRCWINFRQEMCNTSGTHMTYTRSNANHWIQYLTAFKLKTVTHFRTYVVRWQMLICRVEGNRYRQADSIMLPTRALMGYYILIIRACIKFRYIRKLILVQQFMPMSMQWIYVSQLA